MPVGGEPLEQEAGAEAALVSVFRLCGGAAVSGDDQPPLRVDQDGGDRDGGIPGPGNERCKPRVSEAAVDLSGREQGEHPLPAGDDHPPVRQQRGLSSFFQAAREHQLAAIAEGGIE
jgi:hypothetical protein